MDFINLTNGILAIEAYHLIDFRYIRIQSTWCEQKRWEEILWTLSDDFLVYAARGEPCYVYDFSEKHTTTRAVWQGLEWIKFVLFRRWYKISYTPMGRVATSREYFEQEYKKLSGPVKARIDYYKKFTGSPQSCYIIGITGMLKEIRREK